MTDSSDIHSLGEGLNHITFPTITGKVKLMIETTGPAETLLLDVEAGTTYTLKVIKDEQAGPALEGGTVAPTA